MNYLLDTHVFIWMLADPDQLHPKILPILQNPGATIHVSSVSAVEIAIKRSLGKLRLDADVQNEVRDRDLTGLSFDLRHASEMEKLPYHHRDPFDRMLIAQARVEGLTLITRDEKVSVYDVVTIEG